MSEITNTIADALNLAADKVREYGEVARLQALIKAQEAKKQDYYYKLGKKYYELYKDAPASDLKEEMDKLIAADEKIDGYKEDLKAATSASEKYTDVGDVPENSCGGEDEEEAKEEEAPATEHFDETV